MWPTWWVKEVPQTKEIHKKKSVGSPSVMLYSQLFLLWNIDNILQKYILTYSYMQYFINKIQHYSITIVDIRYQI